MEAVINKVRKLLAKAENNPFPHEAQTALLKAQEFMAKHGISMADVEDSKVPDRNEVIDQEITNITRTPWWQKWLSTIIADNFRCHVYTRIRGGRSVIRFIGRRDDIEIAKNVFSFAAQAIRFYSDRYLNELRKRGLPTKGVRNDYIRGFLKGLTDKFAEQVNKNDWGLVLVKDAEVDTVFNNLTLKNRKGPLIQSAQNQHAISEGYRRGQAFESPGGAIE